MKVLIVNSYDTAGGAARAASRLHNGLRAIGVESQMLVMMKGSDDPAVLGPEGKVERILPYLFRKLERWPLSRYPQWQGTPFSPAWLSLPGVVQKINEQKPDLVHLHWCNQGFLRPESLAGITAPLVWSLHDNWALTGGCHVKWGCERFLLGCGRCPQLGSDRDSDLSARQWQRKQQAFAQRKNLTVVGLSRWLADEAKRSPIFAGVQVEQLPNPIDTAVYKPMPKEAARNLFGMPLQMKLILFGALEAGSDPNKGFVPLKNAIGLLKSRDAGIVVLGSRAPASPAFPGFAAFYPGQLQDDVALAALYSAADLVVVPSLQENLSNTIMESLSCGTPVVAFATSGNGDLVDHQQNGFLARCFDPASLAEGIDWVLQHPAPQQLAERARATVEQRFAAEKVARRYLDLYQRMLSGNG